MALSFNENKTKFRISKILDFVHHIVLKETWSQKCTCPLFQ